MTPRDLFALILKTIGLYLIIGAFVSIPQIISSLYPFLYTTGGTRMGDIFEICFFILFSISFYVWFLYLCLFRTDWIINKLRLDQGFTEEKLEINIHRSSLLRIAVIVMGGFLIVDSLPLICKNLLTYFQTTSYHVDFKDNIASAWLIFYFIKFFIGFSLISANRPIVNYIERKRKGPAIKPAETTEE